MRLKYGATSRKIMRNIVCVAIADRSSRRILAIGSQTAASAAQRSSSTDRTDPIPRGIREEMI